MERLVGRRSSLPPSRSSCSRTIAREPLACEGGTTFTFVTDGIESALAQAREAAAGKDISLSGGAEAARQYLAAGLVDEMEISLVTIFLGDGERLFEGLGAGNPQVRAHTHGRRSRRHPPQVRARLSGGRRVAATTLISAAAAAAARA